MPRRMPVLCLCSCCIDMAWKRKCEREGHVSTDEKILRKRDPSVSRFQDRRASGLKPFGSHRLYVKPLPKAPRRGSFWNHFRRKTFDETMGRNQHAPPRPQNQPLHLSLRGFGSLLRVPFGLSGLRKRRTWELGDWAMLAKPSRVRSGRLNAGIEQPCNSVYLIPPNVHLFPSGRTGRRRSRSHRKKQ